MEITTGLFVIGLGLVAGFFNTVGGGGSLLSMPALIFLGFSPIEANATNRVAITVQNASAMAGFRSKGVGDLSFSLLLGIFATAGAALGAHIALDTSGETFKRILAAVMVVSLGLILWNPVRRLQKDQVSMDGKHRLLAATAFFFVGIYGGFIQAGAGFVILLCLTLLNGMDLVRANSVKVTVMFVYSLGAFTVFAFSGSIRWSHGLLLALGNALGGWLGSMWVVSWGEKWVRRVLVLAVLAMAAKLTGMWSLLYDQLAAITG